MIELAIGHDETVAAWVADKLPEIRDGFGPCTSIGVVENGTLIGGTVFHNYHPEHGIIEMSSAAISPRWLGQKMVNAIFGYVFDQLGCQMAVMQVSENNTRMISIAERFGFTGHIIPRLRGRDENGWIFTLTDDDWRQSRFRRHADG